MNRRPFVRTLLASAAAAAAIALAGCDTDGVGPSGRAQAPLSEKMVAEFEQKNMDKESPILVRIFKNEAEFEVWKQDRTGKYALLKTYPICRWSGDLGPKVKEGDRQAPEGFYTITPGQMNPNSNYYLAFNTGYPNAFDRALGRTGSELMVHGDCSSRGCYAMTDEQMQEIYALARESFFGGQRAFQLQAYPFRMTPINMAKHRNSPHLAFWKMIKEGYDHFEVTHQEPKVDFCEKRYVFDPVAPEGSLRPLAFNARAKCPVYEIPKEIADAVYEKKRQDEIQTAELIARGTPLAPSRIGVDGGMNPVFLAALKPSEVTDNDGKIRATAPTAPLPGRLPAVVNPPAEPAEAAPTTPAPVVLANVPVPRRAPLSKEGQAPESPTPTFASLIGGIFGGSSSETTRAPAEPKVTPQSVGLRGSDTRVPAPKARSISIVRSAEAATATPAETESAAPTSKAAAKGPIAQPKPRVLDEPKAASAEMRTAYSGSNTNSGSSDDAGVLKGSQPVLSTGSFNSFDSRWSGLR